MIVNIDWLQLSVYRFGYGHLPRKKDPITIAMLGEGGVVEFLDNPYGEYPKLKFTPKTELLSDAFLYYAEDDFIYLGELMLQRCDLREGLLKIDNSLLYTHNMARDTNLYRIIICALENSGWMFKHITRCDICVDFIPADNPIMGRFTDVPRFIGGIVSGKILRCSMGAKRATMSTQTANRERREGANYKIVKAGGDFSYIRFSNYLPTSVLYNKSLEFRTKSQKTHIAKMWINNGMDDTLADVWRVELRYNFKGSAYSEAICKRLHCAFNAPPTPINEIIAIVNEYIDNRLSFKAKNNIGKVPIFSPDSFVYNGVTSCNLTEYKLYAKLPSVSSYHIGLCKFLRGYVQDLQTKNISAGVPVDSIKETADYLMEQFSDLLFCRASHSLAHSVKTGFYSRKQLTRSIIDTMTDEQRGKYLEINVLQSEIKSAAKLKRTAQNIITTKIEQYNALRGDLAAFVDVPPLSNTGET